MPRTSRGVIDGGTYHVLTRGNNAQTVFHHDRDFQRYLQVLSTHATMHRLQIYHFVLMPNHVHLVLEVPRGEALSKTMLAVNLTYSLFYHKRYRSSGHLWQGRFKSLLIDRGQDLLECGRFIELNPVRAALVRDPKDYPWSSYRAYAQGGFNPLLAVPHPLYETLGASPAERQARYRQFIHEGMRAQRPLPPSAVLGLTGNAADPLEDIRDRLGFPVGKRRRGRPKKIETSLRQE